MQRHNDIERPVTKTLAASLWNFYSNLSALNFNIMKQRLSVLIILSLGNALLLSVLIEICYFFVNT